MARAMAIVPATCAPQSITGWGGFFVGIAGVAFGAGFKDFYSERSRAMSRRWISLVPS